jgi:hypothetical protein
VEILAIAAFILLGIIEYWVRLRAFQYLRYRGESRIRANRNLTHLAAAHYVPEGAKWLTRLRLITAAWIISFLAAFWSLVS